METFAMSIMFVVAVLGILTVIILMAKAITQPQPTQLSLSAVIARNNERLATTYFCHSCHTRHGSSCPNQ